MLYDLITTIPLSVRSNSISDHEVHNKAIPPDKTLLEMGGYRKSISTVLTLRLILDTLNPYENTDSYLISFVTRYSCGLQTSFRMPGERLKFDPEFDGRDETGQLLVPYSREWETFSHPNPHNDDDINIDEDEVDLIPEPLILSSRPHLQLIKTSNAKRPRRRIDYKDSAIESQSTKTRQPSAWKQAHDKEVRDKKEEET